MNLIRQLAKPTQLGWLVVGLGAIGLGVAGATWRGDRTHGPVPGELIAAAPTQTWRSPLAADPAADRTVRFDLVNQGDTPVQIRDVQFNCGCMEGDAEPRSVPPHGRSVVTARPTPIRAGQKRVAITVQTDSVVRPSLQLDVVVTGSSLPPYLLRLEGDLGEMRFDESDLMRASREFRVETEELRGRPETSFSIRCSLPFLEVVPRGMTESPHGGGEQYVGRSYKFALQATRMPPEQSFVGEIAVVDPWEPGRALPLRAYGHAEPPIRALPERLVLDAAGIVGEPASAHLIIRSAAGTPRVEPEPDAADVLTVAVIGAGEDDRFSTYRVRLRSGASVAAKVVHLRASADSRPDGSISIPVMIKDGSQRP